MKSLVGLAEQYQFVNSRPAAVNDIRIHVDIILSGHSTRRAGAGPLYNTPLDCPIFLEICHDIAMFA